MNGVPCHATPDPFDPSTKNVPDHVLLELGIPKPDLEATTQKKQQKQNTMDRLMMKKTYQPQMLIQTAESNDEEMNVENEKEMQFSSSEDMIGMSSSAMNGNSPSEKSLKEMNSKNSNPLVYEDKMNI